MRYLIPIFAAALALAACDEGNQLEGDSAPSEESPVAPAVVCEAPAEDGSCPEFDNVITDEDLADGNVVTEGEVAPADDNAS